MTKKTSAKKNNYAVQEKTVFITGALGQLGKAIVLHLLGEGAFVYMGDVRKSLPRDFKKELEAHGYDSYEYLSIDVSSLKSIKKTASLMKKSVDILINCAGIGVFTPLEDRTEKELDSVYEVNLKGTILCSQVFAKNMVKNGGGKIINFGSIYGMVTPDFRIYGDSGRNSSEIYGATKAGIIHTTKYMAAYFAKHNILVNSVSPGGVFRSQAQYFLKRYKEKTPMGRLAEPEDLVGAVAFLCSDESNYITGQNIAIDGGFTVW